MGRDAVKLEAHAAVSRHNSAADDVDNATWNAFVTEVRHLARRVRYAHLGSEVSADHCPAEAHFSGPSYDDARDADA